MVFLYVVVKGLVFRKLFVAEYDNGSSVRVLFVYVACVYQFRGNLIVPYLEFFPFASIEVGECLVSW